ncbi:unnamed protein product [Oikopleura dioica]|uniref:Uncharacterized protein n=1 Tax=Oikopleura dioica TaxID=34765 RepID=E4WRK1_OIKDI|nr:unnamed protein product [Oikopleura dioica]
MKFSLIFIQIAAGWVTERRCIALKLICSGGSSSFVYDEACMGDVPPNGRMIINPSRNARKGNNCGILLSTGTHTVTPECQNPPTRQENGGLQWTTYFYSYVLSLRTEALTCRQSPSDGLYMPWTERQTREYSWNTELGRLELENAYSVY